MLRLALLLGILGSGAWFGLGKVETESVYPFDGTRVNPLATGLRQVTERQVKTDGETLVVWTSPARKNQPTILYFHGNAGNLADRASRFRRFLDRGYGLVAPAYRGSSGSTGTPNEEALTRDTRQIYLNLDKMIPGLTSKSVVIYGESLGTGVALKLIALADTPQPRAVVLEAPFTSIPDVLLHLYPQMAPMLNRLRNIWQSKVHVRALHAPLLVVHGTDDALIPIRMGRQVFDSSSSKSKYFSAIKGAGHTDVWRRDSLQVLWRFIDGL